MTGETVSVIIPCYNDGAYLREAVESVRKQTWPQVECIIIDDASTDEGTKAELKRLEGEGIPVLRGAHRGPAAARNMGIRASRGEYILPLDADDLIEATYIEKAMGEMQAHPEARVVYCLADFFGEKSGAWTTAEFSMKRFLTANCIFVSAVFSREDWEKAGGFREDYLDGMEDYDFWLSLIRKEEDVIQIPETLFHYRIKKNSRSDRIDHDMEKLYAVYEKLYSNHRELFDEHMGVIFPTLKTLLTEQQTALDRLTEDPMIQYWQSVKALKPRKAERMKKWLKRKRDLIRFLRGK